MNYRWLILAAGTLSATSLSAVQIGVSAITPALRTRYGLSIGEIGIVLGATNAGMTLTLLGWGIISDRIGERLAIVIGLTGSALSLAIAASVNGFAALVAARAAGPSCTGSRPTSVDSRWGSGRQRFRSVALPVPSRSRHSCRPRVCTRRSSHLQ